MHPDSALTTTRAPVRFESTDAVSERDLSDLRDAKPGPSSPAKLATFLHKDLTHKTQGTAEEPRAKPLRIPEEIW